MNAGELSVRPMVPLIEKHLPAITALCLKHQVQRLELFGSTARNESDADSDVDFFVEFHDLDWQGSFRRYMGTEARA